MDTYGNGLYSNEGYLSDMCFSHDMPMRTGPWGFTRRAPFNWHTSMIETAAFSYGTMAPRKGPTEGKDDLDVTMKHGFCPSFHKTGVICNEISASASSKNIKSCVSSGRADLLLDRQHRYTCNPVSTTTVSHPLVVIR